VTLSPSKNEVGDDRGNDWSLPEYSLWKRDRGIGAGHPPQAGRGKARET
jgi:hypothetical protein